MPAGLMSLGEDSSGGGSSVTKAGTLPLQPLLEPGGIGDEEGGQQVPTIQLQRLIYPVGHKRRRERSHVGPDPGWFDRQILGAPRHDRPIA